MSTIDARGDAPPATPLLRRRDVGALALMPWLAGGALAQDGMTLRDKLGPLYGHGPHHHQPARFGKRHWNDAATPIVRWNEVAIDASGIDHTPLARPARRASSASSSGLAVRRDTRCSAARCSRR